MKGKPVLLKIFSRLGLILAGTISGLIVLEVVFRILYPDPSPKLLNQGLQRHEIYGISFTPNVEGWNTNLRGEYVTYVRINNKGLRGKEYPYRKNADTYRILVLGDSFTAALQVAEEDTFPSVLESMLNQTYPHLNFEVINAGVVGYGTANELSYFIHEGHKYQPDLVLLAFFTGNDFTDNVNPPHYELVDGNLIPIQAIYSSEVGTPPWARSGTFFRNLRNFLYTHSRLYSVSVELFVFAAIRNFPDLAQLLASSGLVEATRPVMNAGNIYSFLQPPEYAWEMTVALISELNKQVEAADSQLLVAILPDETEVDVEKWEAIFKEYPNLFARQSIKPVDRLAQVLQREDILHLQVLPAFRAYQDPMNEPLYYRLDGHWKPEGHQIAAQAIYNYLIQNSSELNNFSRSGATK